MIDLEALQSSIREFGFDGWLLYDFRGCNPLARRILKIDERLMHSRRFLYWIPAYGPPRKLVHRIEAAALDHLPGEKTIYLAWDEFEWGVASLVRGSTQIAMEYSPRNAIPYISRVDAGTIELVRSYGVEVASSGDLVQRFEAVWSDEQWRLHNEAGRHTNAAYELAWNFIAERTRHGGTVHELEVQKLITDHFDRNNLTYHHAPIVGVNAHAGDPHYEPAEGDAGFIRRDDLVLIDLWAKVNHPDGVYSDLTRMGFVGETVPEKYAAIFRIVAAARDAAIAFVRSRYEAGEPMQGWEVDQACRAVIQQAGYGEYFVHRTGHNIGREVHGNGANIDGLETRDLRLLLPRTCFSIEPGIYLPEFGCRSEVDVYLGEDRRVYVTAGELQREIVPILK